jgi:uncharacterized DUF497 family protein
MITPGIDLLNVSGFDWNEGNQEKNKKHGVTNAEIEEILFNPPFVILPDTKHSDAELRSYCFGKTFRDRMLLLVFTIRNNKIRPISARAMNRKERSYYEEKIKASTKI